MNHRARVASHRAELKKRHHSPQNPSRKVVGRIFVGFPVAQHARRARQVILSARLIFVTGVILIPHLTKIDPLVQLWVAYSVFFHGVACRIQLGGCS